MRKTRIFLGIILVIIGMWLIIPEDQYIQLKNEALQQAPIPSLVKDAIVSSEDNRFYYHIGVDPIAILRAFKHNVTTDGDMHGGSTITQQLVKNQMLSPERTMKRKIIEFIYSVKADFLLTKDEIITFYGNSVYFGEGAYGVEAAARAYFNKSAEDLSLSEVSLIVGILPAPSIYTPSENYNYAKTRQHYVLNRMVYRGFITEEDAIEAYNAPLHFAIPVANNSNQSIPVWVKANDVESSILSNNRQSRLYEYKNADSLISEAAFFYLLALSHRIFIIASGCSRNPLNNWYCSVSL